MAEEKFHLSKQGPAPCTATERACPMGGKHYLTRQEAEAAFSERHGGRLVPSFTKPKNPHQRPVSTFTAVMEPMKGGSYAGATVEAPAVAPAVAKLREHLGPEEYERMKAQKDKREAGDLYHMTLLAPQEVRRLKNEGRLESAYKRAPRASVEVHGVGKAVEGEKIAYFALCRSPEVAAWRESLGLPKKDLHITLAFDGGDVHSQPKDESSSIL